MKCSCLAVVLCFVFTSSPLFAQPNVGTAALTFTTIDVPGAGFTDIWGINVAGDVVGNYGTNSSDPHKRGFLYRNSTFTTVGYPGAYSSSAEGINDSGMIVGYSEFSGGSSAFGFAYDGSTYTPIKDGSNSSTVVDGINNAGVIVGGTGTIFSARAFELVGGQFKLVRFPGPNVEAFATGVNNLGVVVGWTGPPYQAYIYKGGTFRNIDFPGATNTIAWGINDRGVVVGWFFGAGGNCNNCAFAWKQGKYLIFSYPGAIATSAAGINFSGQIVGSYELPDFTCHGFVTSPISQLEF